MFRLFSMLVKLIVIVLIMLALGKLVLNISSSRQFMAWGEPITALDKENKVIALTFDDGPSENTEKILNKLAELDVNATFFLIGSEIEKNPGAAKAIIESGHQVGNHSYSHKRMIFKTYGFCKEEIEKTDQLIRASGYQERILFRPPYFKKLLILPYYLDRQKRSAILCDIEPESALGYRAAPNEYGDYIISHVQPGSIILLHPMVNTDTVLEALDIFVPYLKEQGYEFCLLNEGLNFTTTDL